MLLLCYVVLCRRQAEKFETGLILFKREMARRREDFWDIIRSGEIV